MRFWRDIFCASDLSFLGTVELLLPVKAVGENLPGEIFQSENRRLTRRMNAFMITVGILDMATAIGVCKTL